MPRRLGGRDVLRGSARGHVAVRKPGTFGGWGGRGKAPKARPLHPRVQVVFRNAVIFLFAWYELGVVPAQFWPFLSETGDPGEAVKLFIRAIGCDPERFRDGDRSEREKVAEIIDFLVMSGDVFDRLSPEARDSLGQRLEAGDYAAVRSAARIAAELRAALDVEALWRGANLLPSFDALLAAIRRLAEHPLKASPDDVEQAARLARAYSAAQTEFNQRCQLYKDITAELTHIWSSTGWVANHEEATLRSCCAGFDTTSEGLRDVRDLNIDQVSLALATMRAHVEELERLLSKARSASGMGASGSDWGSRHSEKERLVDEALAYFGYSRDRRPTRQELKLKRRSFQMELHRHKPPNYENEMKHVNVCHDHIKDFLDEIIGGGA